jgi:hypothetical protein
MPAIDAASSSPPALLATASPPPGSPGAAEAAPPPAAPALGRGGQCGRAAGGMAAGRFTARQLAEAPSLASPPSTQLRSVLMNLTRSPSPGQLDAERREKGRAARCTASRCS